MPRAKKRAVPVMNPREPLTKKARMAIERYVQHFGEQSLIQAVDRTLKAERMRREALYQWLDDHGYRWDARFGYWIKRQE